MQEEKDVSTFEGGQKEEDAFTAAVDTLADAVIQDLEKDYQSDLESFESYAERKRVSIHADMREFKTHFLKGYEVLLEEVTRRYVKAEEEKPPPGAIIL